MAGPPEGGIGAVLAYHESTKHSPVSIRSQAHFLDWDNRPHPFKVHAALERVPLPDDVPSLAVPALEAIGVTSVDAATPGPDLPALARLLVLGAGVHHTVRFPGGEVIHFRNYASAGALYPVEVYVACADLPGLPAGVFHFDPALHALTPLREGDHRGHLVRAAGSEASIGAPVIFVLTGIPWRTGWKYAERGYRHLFWDAGMILANVLALAASAKLPARVVLGFVDSDVASLLGLEERRELPLCLVPVGLSDREVAAASGEPEEVSFEVGALSRTEYVFQGILEANDAGRLHGPEEVARWREGFGGSRVGDGSGEALASPEAGLSTDSLEEVIGRRGSARVFARGSIRAEVLAAILARCTVGVPTDYAPDGAFLAEPYLIANAVEGIGPGAYVFRGGELSMLRAGEFRREAGFLCLEQRLAVDAAATHFLMADLPRTLDALGARGYRAAQLEAGIVAGRIYLGAYASRFGATGLTFYDDEVTRFFSPDAEGKSCMLVVAVGESPRLRRV